MCETKARLDGKVAVITGSSSGMGYEAAKNLANRGARVILASRNETKLARAKDRIQKITGNNNVDYRLVDLSSLKSVRNFVHETINGENRLDILVNNAGAIALPDRSTEDELNLTMQVNYFGTFLLTYLLLPMLKASAPSRIITGTSSAMYIGKLEFDHWNDIGRYNTVSALANSKLATDLFSVELDRRFKDFNVTSNTYDPFVVRDTDILQNMPVILRNVSKLFVDIVGQPKEEVGKQIAYLAAEPSLETVSGEHNKFCHKWINHWLASDELLTKTLWDETKKVVKISPDEDWEVSVR